MKAAIRVFWKIFDWAWFIIFFVMLILMAHSCGASWYTGIIHAHSTFSDGDRTPGMLKNAAKGMGVQFLIVTDHVEQIDNKKKSLPRTDLLTDDFGYEKYLKDFSAPTPLICLAGTEITTINGTHILALSHTKEVFEAKLSKTDQQQVITRLNELSALPVAAHPSIKKYFFKREKTQGIRGIEFFNDGADYQQTLKWYLELVAKGESPFVIAGCDSHSSLEPLAADPKRWLRKTMVFLTNNELSAENIISAITAGRTCATNGEAFTKLIGSTPQSTSVVWDKPFFGQEILLAKPLSKLRKIQIYRDGVLQKESAQPLVAGRTAYYYLWEDKNVTSGKHSYILEIEGCLITSPIWVEYKPGFLEVNGLAWDKETISQLFPSNVGRSNYPADQAQSCVKGFFKAFNGHQGSQAVLDCFAPDSRFAIKGFAEMSTSQYWESVADDSTRPESLRKYARDNLAYIRQHGLPVFSLDKFVMVTVAKENKEAVAIIEDFEFPPTTFPVSGQILVCKLQRNDKGEFKLVSMTNRPKEKLKEECDRALGKTLARDYKYNRRFANLR